MWVRNVGCWVTKEKEKKEKEWVGYINKLTHVSKTYSSYVYLSSLTTKNTASTTLQQEYQFRPYIYLLVMALITLTTFLYLFLSLFICLFLFFFFLTFFLFSFLIKAFLPLLFFSLYSYFSSFMLLYPLPTLVTCKHLSVKLFGNQTCFSYGRLGTVVVATLNNHRYWHHCIQELLAI